MFTKSAQRAAKKWRVSIRVDDGTVEPGTGVGMTVGQWLVERGVLTEPRAAGRPCVSLEL